MSNGRVHHRQDCIYAPWISIRGRRQASGNEMFCFCVSGKMAGIAYIFTTMGSHSASDRGCACGVSSHDVEGMSEWSATLSGKRPEWDKENYSRDKTFVQMYDCAETSDWDEKDFEGTRQSVKKHDRGQNFNLGRNQNSLAWERIFDSSLQACGVRERRELSISVWFSMPLQSRCSRRMLCFWNVLTSMVSYAVSLGCSYGIF